MSWYFFGGFSAYWIVPSGRWANHVGCSVTHGWSGVHWKAMSRASSMPRRWHSSASLTTSSTVPSSGCTAVCPPSGAPIAHGLPVSSDDGVVVLLRPLRWVVPIGCTGGR